MHICIVGTGASGWLTCHFLQKLSFVNKITIIGSKHIPTIGVGESTTYNFINLLHSLFENEADYWKFILKIDGAIKYGVSYEGWSEKKFLHAFVGKRENNLYGYLLGKLKKEDDVNRYMMPYIDEIYSNNFCPDLSAQTYSFHFDANKLIEELENLSKDNKKINHVIGTVVNSNYKNDEEIDKLFLDNNDVIEADYYISCIGQTSFNQNIFKEKYQSYSNVLLTNKAVVCPLEYKNKREEFHPYTIAKSMNHGWRWITPTSSRIGTGYVFSNNHISEDDVAKEFEKEIGISSDNFNIVDFYPRKSTCPYKKNSCTLGMASGFLEPLDAPGLNILISFYENLEKILHLYKCNKSYEYSHYVEVSNIDYNQSMDWWASFILHQYKTSSKNTTSFWKDQKEVEYDHYNSIIENIFNPLIIDNNLHYRDRNTFIFEPYMFYNTTAGKGISWEVKSDLDPTKSSKYNFSFVNHYDFFEFLKNEFI
jgi:tryptophan halogenase|tara:strand:- start:1229 stop:2668 length:1440 start_codon:yes stop_codon:yes gene_type:complete